MKISKTKISKQTRKKTNSELVKTILLAKKYNFLEVAKMLSSPARKRISLNLEDIDESTKDGEAIIIPGKVLGQGDLRKKVKVTALNFSSSAIEKLKKAKCEIKIIGEELEKNKKIEGRILRIENGK